MLERARFVRSLLGLDQKAKISWKFSQQDIAQLPIEKRNLAVVFQEPALFPHMSAQANIWFPVRDKKNSQDRFDHLVDNLKLTSLLKKSVQKLSGGEKQRVAIARALIYQPRVLLLDEPFSSLDEKVRPSIRQMVKELCQEYQCSVLLITHDRGDVVDLAQKVSFIEGGRIFKECPVEQFPSEAAPRS